MERIVRQGLLYDFYGALLNEHQRNIYEAFVYDNMSLSEIAEEQGITRQGVHDLIKRCDKSLTEYEDKLHLVDRFMSIKSEVEQIEARTDSEEIRMLAAKILEQL